MEAQVIDFALVSFHTYNTKSTKHETFPKTPSFKKNTHTQLFRLPVLPLNLPISIYKRLLKEVKWDVSMYPSSKKQNGNFKFSTATWLPYCILGVTQLNEARYWNEILFTFHRTQGFVYLCVFFLGGGGKKMNVIFQSFPKNMS